MKNGSNDVKGHKWFKDINWDDVSQKKLKVLFGIHMVPPRSCQS